MLEGIFSNLNVNNIMTILFISILIICFSFPFLFHCDIRDCSCTMFPDRHILLFFLSTSTSAVAIVDHSEEEGNETVFGGWRQDKLPNGENQVNLYCVVQVTFLVGLLQIFLSTHVELDGLGDLNYILCSTCWLMQQ